MQTSPERFLMGLVDPFLDGDFEKIADFYEEPMLIIRPNGERSFRERAVLCAELSAAAAHISNIGAVATRMESFETREYGGMFLLADVRWGYLDNRAHLVAEFNATYLLRDYGDSYKIAAHITHFERLLKSAA